MSSMNIEYRRNGDYLIPNIELNQPQTPLGKYGRMRRMFLKENRPILYNHLLLSGKLYPHLAEIDQAAKQRLEQMMLTLTQAAGATEELKARDPMQWTGRMNACKAQAEEVIRNERTSLRFFFFRGGLANSAGIRQRVCERKRTYCGLLY